MEEQTNCTDDAFSKFIQKAKKKLSKKEANSIILQKLAKINKNRSTKNDRKLIIKSIYNKNIL